MNAVLPFVVISAPSVGLEFIAGKPKRLLEPGIHVVLPLVTEVRRISTALVTQETNIDIITRGGTPATVQVGFTARVVDARKALVNVANAFATLRASVVAVVSGAANAFTIDELAKEKVTISNQAEAELMELSDSNGWGLGQFQIAVGDPNLSEDLKRLLMREEAVKRENAANLAKAQNQLEVGRTLLKVANTLEPSPFARELLRPQMLADMGAGGKVVVVDTDRTNAVGIAGVN